LKKRAEESGTSKTDLRECLAVRCKDLLDTVDLWLGWVAVHSKAVIDTVDSKVTRDTTEAKDWKQFIRIIWLNNLTNVEDSALILVLSTEEMKRLRRTWLTI